MPWDRELWSGVFDADSGHLTEWSQLHARQWLTSNGFHHRQFVGNATPLADAAGSLEVSSICDPSVVEVTQPHIVPGDRASNVAVERSGPLNDSGCNSGARTALHIC